MGSTPPLGYNYVQLFGQIKEDDYPYTSGNIVTSSQVTSLLLNLREHQPDRGLPV